MYECKALVWLGTHPYLYNTRIHVWMHMCILNIVHTQFETAFTVWCHPMHVHEVWPMASWDQFYCLGVSTHSLGLWHWLSGATWCMFMKCDQWRHGTSFIVWVWVHIVWWIGTVTLTVGYHLIMKFDQGCQTVSFTTVFLQIFGELKFRQRALTECSVSVQFRYPWMLSWSLNVFSHFIGVFLISKTTDHPKNRT